MDEPPRPARTPGPVSVVKLATFPDWTEAEGWQKQGEIAGPVFTSEDAREGAIAFAEKRDPVWKGK